MHKHESHIDPETLEELSQGAPGRLCQNSIFEGFTPEQIRNVLPCITYAVKDYGSEECVLDKGGQLQGLGVVLEGALVLCREDADGQRDTVASLGENDLLGEAALFSSDGGAPHQVVADDGARVLFLSKDFFTRSCGDDCPNQQVHQGIIRNMLRVLSDQAVSLNKKIAYLSAPDLKTKIAMYLYELYEMNRSLRFTMPLNRDRLADFFSVARPSLSRELINLKAQGIIDFQRSNVEILDLDGLYRLSLGQGQDLKGPPSP